MGPQHACKFAAKMAEMEQAYFFHEMIGGKYAAGTNAAQQVRTVSLEFTYAARQRMDRECKFVR